MSVLGFIRWGLFVLYLGFFFTVPISVLGGVRGAAVGVFFWIAYLVALRFRASERIARRLAMRPFSKAESPRLFRNLELTARRLEMRPPKIGIIPSDAVNVALFGFSKDTATLAITRGALEKLSPTALGALVTHELTLLWHNTIAGDCWLSQFLASMETLIGSGTTEKQSQVYGFGYFVRQIVLYPFCLIPVLLLKSRRSTEKLDDKAIRLMGSPQELAEALRCIDAYRERHPVYAPTSVRHLFLVPPPAEDPLVRILFDPIPLQQRIQRLETPLRQGL